MNNVLEECKKEINSLLYNKMSKEELMNSFIKERLLSIYDSENKQFDSILVELEKNVKYNNYSQVKSCVTKMMRLLDKNRKSLIDTLRRIY